MIFMYVTPSPCEDLADCPAESFSTNTTCKIHANRADKPEIGKCARLDFEKRVAAIIV